MFKRKNKVIPVLPENVDVVYSQAIKELEAVKEVYRTMRSVPPCVRMRVFRYVSELLGDDERGDMGESKTLG
jgi:hypothetical protein